MKNRLAVIVGVMTLTLFAFTTASAQENAQGVEVSSGVARISLIHGDVSTQRGDSGDWAAAVLNQPIVNGDKVSAGVRSRAEVQLDQSNIMRLGDNTLATVAGLSRTQIQIQVARGLVDYTLFKGTEADVEIDTANAAVHPSQKDGIYRVEVNSSGETQVIVRKGEAEISTPQGSTRVDKGQMVIVRGSGDEAQYRLAEAPSKDGWDSWNSDRDRIIRDAQSWQHTNRYYVGSEDLDAYGRWVTVPDYGSVWSPVVSVGWAPYRSGRWVWEPGWGWTWVSYEPWGWAPYHYGRWFMYNSSWVWWPGPVYGYPRYRPVWAPAYVSFFGFGSGGFGFGFGSVGWLPVGPCDRFYPWYGRYGSRFNQVNVVNITNITNIHNGLGHGFDGIAPLRAGGAYSNLRRATIDERVRQGISTVPAEHFGKGRFTPVPVDREVFRGGRMMAGNLPVVPTRESLSASNRPAAEGTLPRGGQQERFFMKSRPVAAPEPFEKQAARMQQAIQHEGQFKGTNGEHGGRGFSNSARPGQNATSSVATDSPRTTVPRPNPGVRVGVDHVQGIPSTSSAQQSGRGATSMENQGWRRFGSGVTQNQAASPAQAPAPARGTLAMPARNGSDRVERPTVGDSQEWRRFSDRLPAQPGSISRPAERSSPEAGPRVPQPQNSARPDSSTNDGNWRHFTPRPPSTVQSSPDSLSRDRMNGNRVEGVSPSRGQMVSPQRESGGWRSPSQQSSQGYSRPPLEMRQPIMTPRVSEGSGGPSRGGAAYGGGSPQPSGGGGYSNGGGHSQPSGGHSQPSGGGGNHGGSGGPPSHSSGPGRGR
jgi:hypothetical protein